MARSFSEKEKQNIKKCLLDACKQHWTQFGYKKTSVDELCKQAGISKGAFQNKRMNGIKEHILHLFYQFVNCIQHIVIV